MDYPHKDLTEKIIGAAFRVHNSLGSGFVEKVYENALALELKRQGLNFRQQQPVTVYYDGELVGEFVADLVVQGIVLLEIKAVKSLIPEYESKLIHYLKATGIELGLLINFGESVEVRRKIYSHQLAIESNLTSTNPSADQPENPSAARSANPSVVNSANPSVDKSAKSA